VRLAHPYASRVKRRYLRQLRRYRGPLARATAELITLLERPVPGDVPGLLRHAWDRVPFWRRRMAGAGLTRLDLGRPEALAALPPLERAEVQERFAELIDPTLSAADEAELYRGTTSGSTGEPVRYAASGFQYLWYWAFVDFALRYMRRRARFIPFRTNVALLCALGHSPEYGDWLPLFHGARFRKVNVLAPGAPAQLARLAPAIITGDPDSLAPLLGVPLRPRLVLSSAFAMPPALRAALEAHLRCPVVEYYSAAETGMLAIACRAGRGYHVLTPAAHIEAIAWGAGHHELLVTNLRNPCFPLIRYRIGDLGRLAHEPCPCGLQAPRITELVGRTAEAFRGRRGPFHPGGLQPLFARLPVRRFRVTEEAAGVYRVETDAPLPSAGREVVDAGLARLYGGPVEVHFAPTLTRPSPPGVKPRPFVARAS